MKNNANNNPNDSQHGKEETNNSSKQDFFAKLQQNEAQNGETVRGKGHYLTTLIETLLGNW